MLIKCIVKNNLNKTLGYDVIDNNGSLHECVSIEKLVNCNFDNATYVGGKNPYLRGKKELPVRVSKDNIVTLYHGSNIVIDKVIYGAGKNDNDYGKGFYTTQDKKRAEEWAGLQRGDSVCNEYELNTEGLKVCNLDDFGPLVWIATVMRGRGLHDLNIDKVVASRFCDKYAIDISKYDIIIGYRADDSFFRIVEAFANRVLTVTDVVNCFYKAKLGIQVCLKTRRAFSKLKFIRSSKVSDTIVKYALNNDRNARNTAKVFINNKRNALIDKNMEGVGKLGIVDCINTNYRYSKERGLYVG